MDLSIVVPSFETPDALGRCLDALALARATRPALAFEVIVVDNGSRDDSARRALASPVAPRVVAFARNRGFAAAADYGLRLARGRHALLLNSDARVSGELLARAVRHLDADPRIAVLGPALRHADGRPQRSVHRWPSLATELLGERGVDFLAERAGRPSGAAASAAVRAATPDPDRLVDVPAVRGAVFFIGASAREKLGGLDERYFFFLEETDYCLRARAAGQRVVFAPGLVAEHLLGASSKARAPGAVRIEYHRSLERFLRRHRAPGVAPAAMAWRALRQTLALPLLAIGRVPGWVSAERFAERRALVLWHLRARPATPSLDAALRATGGSRGGA